MNAPTVKILACPFCGKQPELTHMPIELYNGCIPTRERPSWMLKCSFLWCPGSSPSAHSESSEDDVISKWNTRAPSSSESELIAERARREKAEEVVDAANDSSRLEREPGVVLDEISGLAGIYRAQYPRVEQAKEGKK
jgi:hypothetical protein